jgi:hypothetical protein
MAVRFYWTLVLIAGGSQRGDNVAVDEAQFRLNERLGSQAGVAGNNLDHRRSSPIFVATPKADLGSTFQFMLRMQT